MSGTWDTMQKHLQAENNQVDDWADFGGFESAQPIPPSLSSSINTGTISWATSAPGPILSESSQATNNIQGEVIVPGQSSQDMTQSPWNVFTASSSGSSVQSIPDVVKTESVPSNLPWGFSTSSAEQSNASDNSLSDRTDDSMPWNQSSISDLSGKTDAIPAHVQKMPWEVSSTPVSSNISDAGDSLTGSSSAIVSDVPWGAFPNSNVSVTQGWSGDVASQEIVQSQEQSVDGGVQTTVNKIKQPLHGPCTVPDYIEEMELLQKKNKECESLQERNQTLQNELEHQKYVLQEQNKKYDLLQAKHQDQLKVLRDSGQEAFALIVEEYKELSKTAVLEQQEQCMRYIREALEEERKKCEEHLKEQNDYLIKLLEQEKQENINRIETSVKELKEKYETQLASAVEEERNQGKEFMGNALEEERESGKKALEEFVERERNTMEKLSQEHKDFTQTLMDEERKKCKELMEEALEQEKRNVKQSLEEAVKNERKKAEEMVKQTLEMTKKEMDSYVQQKLKDDAVIRQKYLLSMDLFLEGTRTQLHSLMEEQKSDVSIHSD